MFSNFISAPSALLAAVANSGPAHSFGPSTLFRRSLVLRQFTKLTSDNHHLSPVLVIQSVFPFTRENMSSDVGNILSDVNKKVVPLQKRGHLLPEQQEQTCESPQWEAEGSLLPLPAEHIKGDSRHRILH